MFYKMLIHNGNKTLVNLSLVQRIVLSNEMIVFVYNTPHITGTFLNNRHYENYFFESPKKADEMFVEIQNEIISKQTIQTKETSDILLKRIIELEKGRSTSSCPAAAFYAARA